MRPLSAVLQLPSPRSARFIPAPGAWACARRGGRWGGALVLACLLAALAAMLAATPVSGQEPPRYRVAVRLDADAHTIAGTLEVRLEPGDPRRGNALWFHLPPNRFIAEDPRGRRRDTDSIPFATQLTGDAIFDSIWPAGFSRGWIDIVRVESLSGAELTYSFAPNGKLPQGYLTGDALMRVESEAALDGVRIVFTTHLPQRYWDGWSDAGVLAEEWYPRLAVLRGENWDFNPFAPTPGRYEAEVALSSAGQLFLGHGWSFQLDPGGVAKMPLDPQPLRVLPLVFLESQPVQARHDYDVSLYSFHNGEHGRVGHLALQIADAFRKHVNTRFRLPPPDTRITIVEVDTPPGDIRTVGGLILVPRVYYQNTRVLDRVLVAQLSRAVAQIWFGEAVWSDRDAQTWLHLGLAGYLALDYFETLYGWDGGVHNIMNWLQPKYREHFFESQMRALMRAEGDAPLMISLHEYPAYLTAVLVTHNKAPIVLRSLHYVVGQEAFARSLNALYFRHRYREVTERTLRDEFSEIAGMDLDPFFQAWFYETPLIDLAVEDWHQEAVPGGYRVDVDVRRTGLSFLPVTVRVVTRDGQVHERRWEWGEDRAQHTFLLEQEAASISIDPEESWLELDRKNNRTEILYRVRPLFDWPKQRELLVTLNGVIGGNSTDGNLFGVGAKVTLNENNIVSIVPLYGERTGLTNYRVLWLWGQFLAPKLDMTATLEHVGGTTLQGLGLQYYVLDTDLTLVRTEIELRAETVAAAGFIDFDGTPVLQTSGVANNVRLELEFRVRPRRHYSNDLVLGFSNGGPALGSEYDFTTYRVDLVQTLAYQSVHVLELQLTRAGTRGTTPLQMRHELGGPLLLRGYPRSVALSNDQIAALQFDYGFVVTRRIIGTAAQIRQMTVFLFGDVGRSWNRGEQSDDRPQRQDVGVGVELRINLFRLIELPLRVDVAMPISDDAYSTPQIILFGLLNF